MPREATPIQKVPSTWYLSTTKSRPSSGYSNPVLNRPQVPHPIAVSLNRLRRVDFFFPEEGEEVDSGEACRSRATRQLIAPLVAVRVTFDQLLDRVGFAPAVL